MTGTPDRDVRRPVRFHIVFEAWPRPGGPDWVARVKGFIKECLRARGLKCIDIETVRNDD